jgi:ParB-like chromosome segregation protein Spo0J
MEEPVLVRVRRLDSISPAPENDDIYHAISLEDPEILELARSIKEHGLQEPLLIALSGTSTYPIAESEILKLEKKLCHLKRKP